MQAPIFWWEFSFLTAYSNTGIKAPYVYSPWATLYKTRQVFKVFRQFLYILLPKNASL